MSMIALVMSHILHIDSISPAEADSLTLEIISCLLLDVVKRSEILDFSDCSVVGPDSSIG